MFLLNDKKNITVIIQARMTSTRLPKKIMLNLGGSSVLGHVVNRCRNSRYVDKVVVVSPDSTESFPIEEWCKNNSVDYFVGSEHDVLKRYYDAACFFNSNIIVRVTSDCPLIDPNILDIMIQNYLTFNSIGIEYDYYSNVIKRFLPRGLDIEIFSFATLEKIYNDSFNDLDREHVTRYIYTNPNKFHIGHFEFPNDLSSIRVTLDTEEDFQMLSELYKKANDLGVKDIYLPHLVTILSKYPSINIINSCVKQKEY